MTYAEQHPHPGEQPPPDPGPCPTDGTFADRMAWDGLRIAHNEWTRKLRRHFVALAMDRLPNEKTAEQRIAYILGAEYLEGGLLAVERIFSGLF